MPDVRLKEEKRNRDEPHAVGALIMDRGLLQVLLPFPADALVPALQALTAGKLRYVTIDGSPLHYRQGSIKYFSLDSKYDPTELPPEEKENEKPQALVDRWASGRPLASRQVKRAQTFL